MPNHYYIISEVSFFKDKDKSRDFISGTGIDLDTTCKSKIPSLIDIKKALLEFGLSIKETLNENNRIEISATAKEDEKLWLIFTDIKIESQEIEMFEIGRGSNQDLMIAFIKSLSHTHGKFLYYCDSGSMTLITKDKPS